MSYRGLQTIIDLFDHSKVNVFNKDLVDDLWVCCVRESNLTPTPFHRCTEESVRLIIHSFFNRLFAEINDQSVRLQRINNSILSFADAVYSQGFARTNALNGKRHMFVTDVLVGDSVWRNKTMKTPPAGYDSTTDNDHIFVTYRDDQAYVAYLIVYKGLRADRYLFRTGNAILHFSTKNFVLFDFL
jgi:hypothetical protein